jgi:2-succinyl-6-hydroxy-2,4-cyclohexadiene-1-carboxylate synthase
VSETIVLLHGFSGTHRTWDAVADGLGGETYRPLALDLRGHGAAAARRPVSFEACVADVLDAAPERFALAGYSMGGRIAQHVALAAPERVTGLVLVSTTAGLEDEEDRAARRAADEALAARVERGSIEDFADTWAAQPLFAREPERVAQLAREDALRNDPQALAEVLRRLGTGAMAPLWGRLGELTMPAMVLAGERDAKYAALGEPLAAALPDGRLVVVPRAGHRLQLEAPSVVAAALSAFGRRRQ